ncbi:MAG: NnrS family protein [Burkholderiales bacterium]|nr:NnrS family protein [Burkholderiales bacterium]
MASAACWRQPAQLLLRGPVVCAGQRANAALHLNQLGWLHLPAALGVPVALDVLLFIIAVMAGRVLPMFTNNGVPGARARRDERVEKAALGSVLALLAADALQLHGPVMAALAALALLAHASRWCCKQPRQTLRHPLVWVLHAAHASRPIHPPCARPPSWDGPPQPAHARAHRWVLIGALIRWA